MSDEAPKKKRSKLSLTNPAEWAPEHDMLLFKRVQRLIAAVPDHAQKRVRAYLLDVIGQERLPLGGQ